MDRTLKIALANLIFNMAYSAYHVILGIITYSWWFFTIGIYYAILSIVRFTVLQHKGSERFLIRFTGTMLIALSVSLVGIVILSFVKDRGTVFPLIVMLTIATYTFTKITLATIKWIKAQKSTSAKMLALRNISFADAFVSIFSLQRSMLVSFEGMSETEIRIMNILTGSAVCVTVFWLGLSLFLSKKNVKHRRSD
ncbi:MAG: hypothetical protein IJD85_00110 [Oscillospiraceae bacterium]|nr:hypothetical protein [Oscillospiraceae bacterium]